jgi:hypothetical protein
MAKLKRSLKFLSRQCVSFAICREAAKQQPEGLEAVPKPFGSYAGSVKIKVLLCFTLFLQLQFFVAKAQSSSEQLVVTRDPAALAAFQSCWTAMGKPSIDTAIEAQGTVTPIISNALSANITLRFQGLRRLRVDTISQTKSGNSVSDSLIYAEGVGYWTGDKTHTGKFYTAARYSHPQLLPLQVCSTSSLRNDLSISLLPPDDSDSIHLQTFVDMRDSKGNTDALEKQISQMDLVLDATTFLPRAAKSFAFDPSNLANHTIWKTEYTGYTTQDGLLLPTAVIESYGSRRIHTITWTAITIDATLSPSTFEIGAN